MTPEQIDNWRKVLVGMLGPYALIMPVEDIEKFKGICRKNINEIEERIGVIK